MWPMSTEPPARPPDEPEPSATQPLGAEPTQRMARPPSGPPRPPAPTQPMYAQSSGRPGRRGGNPFVWLLFLLVGLGGGFLISQQLSKTDPRIPSEDLVLFEPASSSFPIDGAQFTQTTFEPQTGACNKESLKAFLRSDQRRLEAWLGLQQITQAQFEDFVNRLETRILRGSTSVTNYGCFADGPCPFGIQSVLATGTPVWWDPVQNRYVAKCACSNPIKAPKCPPNCESGAPPASQTSSPTTQPSPSITPSVEPSIFPTPEPDASPPVDCSEEPNAEGCL